MDRFLRSTKLGKIFPGNHLKSRHRASDQAFTRVRCLPFAVVLVLILRKSVKSLQNVVNEAMVWLLVEPVTASAFSQARYQLQHIGFIELSQQAVVESRYRDADFRTFWGFRVIVCQLNGLGN